MDKAGEILLWAGIEGQPALPPKNFSSDWLITTEL